LSSTWKDIRFWTKILLEVEKLIC